jgi:hypothetical protein
MVVCFPKLVSLKLLMLTLVLFINKAFLLKPLSLVFV